MGEEADVQDQAARRLQTRAQQAGEAGESIEQTR